MDAETFLGIVCLIGAIVCRIVFRYCSENVYIRYAGDKKRCRPGAGTSKGGKGNYCSASVAQKRR